MSLERTAIGRCFGPARMHTFAHARASVGRPCVHRRYAPALPISPAPPPSSCCLFCPGAQLGVERAKPTTSPPFPKSPLPSSLHVPATCTPSAASFAPHAFQAATADRPSASRGCAWGQAGARPSFRTAPNKHIPGRAVAPPDDSDGTTSPRRPHDPLSCRTKDFRNACGAVIRFSGSMVSRARKKESRPVS